MVCRIQDYLRERQAREDEEAAKKAGKKEVADRIYERLKGQAQAEAAAREEEDRLINLLRAEEEAERSRRSAATIHLPASFDIIQQDFTHKGTKWHMHNEHRAC